MAVQTRRALLPLLLAIAVTVPQVSAEFWDDVGRGLVPGHTVFILRGYSDSVGTTRYVIGTNENYTYPAAATTMNLSSTSAADAAGGNGARVVHVWGLDASLDIIEENVTLQGQTPVSTVHEYYRVNRLTVVEAGSSGSNVGTIYIGSGPTTGGEPATIYHQVAPTYGASTTAAFTVPRGYKAYMTFFLFGTITAKRLEVYMQVRRSAAEPWRVTYYDRLNQEHVFFSLTPPYTVEGGSDVEFTAQNDIGTTTATLNAFLVLADEDYASAGSGSLQNLLVFLGVVVVLVVVLAWRR